jgi:alkylation response protein AidB-like acyl-CoA dehydrogenase
LTGHEPLRAKGRSVTETDRNSPVDIPAPEVVEELLTTVRRWLAADVAPHVLEFEHADTYPSEMVEQLKDFGLFGATIAPEYGGLGLSATAYARLVDAISQVWMSLAGVFNSHLMMAELVARFGTPPQREHFLPAFATGELRGGLALTEPQGGTDLQAILTTATAVHGHYMLKGSKSWITNGLNGSCLAVLVKTDPDAAPRHRGMSVFLVTKGPGFVVGRKFDKLGYRSIDTVEIFFDDHEIDETRLVGGLPGEGFSQVMSVLELGRLNVAARGVGIATASLDAALAYSQERHSMGKPICEHQSIQIKLAEMACRVESARLLVQRAAEAYDAGQRSDLEAGMAKLVASEAAMENAADCMRVFGAAGYSRDSHVERYYRDAPLLCIGEGTNEIQRIVIARQLVERSRRG